MIDWKDVNEKLPEKNKLVLALIFSELSVEIGEITERGLFLINRNSFVKESDLKYWAYINKPKEQTNG